MLKAQETPPRISGKLYNCALNCALPTILGRIKTIAEQESDAGFPDGYRQLKTMFEQWYCIDEMTWVQFDKFLSNSEFTFNDKELIFAPVLRLFLAEKAKESGCVNTENLRDIIEHKTQGIAPDVLLACVAEEIPFNYPGRYMPIDAHDSNQYFYQHFGLFMCVREFRGSTYESVNGPAPDALQPISTYLKGGHYELQEHEKTTAPQYTKLQEMLDIMAGGPFDDTPAAQRTNQALGAVRNFVEIEIKAQSEHSSKSFLITPKEYCANVERFNLHEENIHGKLTHILVLLTLMKNFKETKDYARDALTKKYTLEQRHEIEALYTELMAYVQLTNVQAILYNSSYNVSKKLMDDKPPNDFSLKLQQVEATSSNGLKKDSDMQVEKSISQQDFRTILNEYQTSYWLLNCIINIISFGCRHHESNTIKALRTLAEKNVVITQKMVTDALTNQVPDRLSQSRLFRWKISGVNYFFNDDKSGTEKILHKLHDKL